MSQLIDERVGGEAEQAKDLVKVFIHQPGKDVQVLKVSPDETIESILRQAHVEVSGEVGVLANEPETDLHADEDDEHEPVVVNLTIREIARGGRHAHIHCHHCRKVAVTVYYNGASREKKFSPARTVAQVRAWAVKKFHLDDQAAEKLVLEFHESDKQPRPEERLGTLVGSVGCEVAFDLVQPKVVEG